MSRVPGGLWQNLIAVQVYGANTGVGKTVLSTLLGRHFAKRRGANRWSIRYIKPVSTGPADEADEGYVRRYASHPVTTLFKFDKPVSPHVAARESRFIPSDDTLIQRLSIRLKSDARACSRRRDHMGISFVETAGGVLSPGPSGTPQADIFRPMRLPAILVGDHRLGGIASTISAAESLLIRGYDIDAVVCFDDGSQYENSKYLTNHFQKIDIPAFEIPWIPDLTNCSEKEETERMRDYYEHQSEQNSTKRLAGTIIDRHLERLKNMKTMASRTMNTIWHPFTQHKHVEKADDILVFDSAYGDYFQMKHTSESKKDIENEAEMELLTPAFDGSASWWTQGLGHGNPQLSLAAAYAAGRYGHVMFAGATHEPALTLAERLLKGLENPRLSRVFYTDDGSTATEVGIKMALRASCKRYNWDSSKEEVGIIGLRGSYHGDTIGAMDASEPCVFNKKVDWYRGRGYWFDFPTVKMRVGRWVVEPPAGMERDFGPKQHFEELDDVFDVDQRAHSPRYEEYITKILDRLVKEEGRKFGALVMEPVILGAGGMIFVDPLFQRTLATTIRNYTFAPSNTTTNTTTTTPQNPDPHSWTGLPILHDEVFTGLYRLGRFSSSSLLQIHPDISTHAKLLTGGLLPLSATLASPSIFAAFLSDSKQDALLHGHSYTAHPLGCHVANTSLQKMQQLHTGDTYQKYMKSWHDNNDNNDNGHRAPTNININPPPPPTTTIHHHFTPTTPHTQPTLTPQAEPNTRTWSMWSKPFVVSLSHHPKIDHVIALGSVLAISLKGGTGYTSDAAAGLRDKLLNDTQGNEGRVHNRVLGNVIYFMASMTSKVRDLKEVEGRIGRALDG